MSTQVTANVTATASIAVGEPNPSAGTNPSHASTRMEGGQAVFENDNYKITAGDNNTVNITNKHTGETYQAWGDPHMKIDGQQAFDFWGTTTFKLDDGTKVTIQTTPWANNPNATLSSKVTITNGDYGVQITGVDTNKTGALKINEAAGWGHTLDWAVDDGNVLQENPTGKGFLAVDAQGNIHAVDQNWINQTDLMKGGKPPADAGGQQPATQDNPLANAFKDAFKALAGLVSISFLGGFLAAVAMSHRETGAPGDNGGGSRAPQGPRFGFEPWLGGGVFLNPAPKLDIAAHIDLTLTRHQA